MDRLGARSAATAVAVAIVMTAFGSAPAGADAIFAVFANPTNGAVAVKGAHADTAMTQQGALEISSIAFGIENDLVIDPEDGAIGPGRPSFRTLSIALPLGPGVPALLQTSGAGGHYGDVTVHFRKDGNQPAEYATLSLKVVAVSSVAIRAGGDPPQATVELTYGSMRLDFYAQDASGKLATTPEVGQWNVMTGTPDYTAVAKP